MSFEDIWAKVAPFIRMTKEEAYALYDLASAAPVSVEIGTLFGGSAAVMAAAGSRVTTIDDYSRDGTSADFAVQNLKEWGVEGVTVVERKNAKNGYAPHLLFIDGGHLYEQVRADIKEWGPKVKGIVAFHDYGSWPGVTEAVDESRFIKQDQAGTLIWGKLSG